MMGAFDIMGILGVQLSLYLLSLYPSFCITLYKIFIQDIYFHKYLAIIGILYPYILPPLSLDTRYFLSKFLEYHRCPAESLSFILASGLFWHRSWLPPALFRQHPSHLPIFCLHRHQTKANTNAINYTHLLLPASIIWSKSITSHRLLSA